MKARNKGILWSYAYTIANMICGLFMSSYLLRMLGDVEYGIYQTIASFANCLVMLEFGTGAVLTKNIVLCRRKNASNEEIDRNISTIWIIALSLSFVIALVGFVLYFCINSLYANAMTTEQIAYAKQIYLITLVHLLSSFMFQTAKSVAMGFENYTFSSKVNLVRLILRTALLIGLIYYLRSAIYIALVDACLSILLFVYTLFFCCSKFHIRFRFRYFEFSIFRASLGLCVALLIQSIINQVNSNVDKFLIGIFVNPETVAMYGIGMYVFMVFSSLSTVPISMFAPQIIGEVGMNGIGEALHKKILQASRVVTLVGGTIFFGFVAVGRQFIEIVYGEKYLIAWLIAIILMSSAFINMITGVLINVLDALNKRIIRSGMLLITTVLNVILTVLWLPNYGIVGAAAATAICTILGQVVAMGLYYTLKLKIKVLDIYWRLLKEIIVYQLLAMIAAGIVSLQIDSAIVSLAVGVFVYLIVFAVMYFIISSEGRQQRKNILCRKQKD